MEIRLTNARFVDIFLVLSEAFSTNFEREQAKYSLQIPPDFGSGNIFGIQYPNGVGFIRFDVFFKEDVQLIYESNQIHPLRFVYCLESTISHQYRNEDIVHTIDQFNSAIIANKYPFGDLYTIPGNQKVALTFLEIDRKVFAAQLQQEDHDMKSIFYEMFFDVYATRTFYHKSLFSLQLAQIIKQIKNFKHQGYVQTNFIGSKALEMLSFMLLQYEDDLRDEGTGKILRKSEINAVHEVAEQIANNLADLPGVDELAKQVTLTPAKLQEGFKLLYDQTVNQYIIDRRMERAFLLLSETDNQISEIILDIGFSSRSHFSKIFKERYKLSPRDLKRKQRSN